MAHDEELFSKCVTSIEEKTEILLTQEEKTIFLHDLKNKEFSINQEYLCLRSFNFELLDLLTTSFFNMTWTVLQAPKDSFFITSDNPLVIQTKRGLVDPDLQISLPLSPEYCLFIHKDKALRTVIISTQQLKQLNTLRAGHAERNLFSHKNDGGIAKLAKKYQNHKMSVFKVRSF